MQFLVTAHDGTDGEALSRRMKVRPQHLENMAKLKEEGHVICAGGLLDGDGRLAGSFLAMEFENREMLDAYLAEEPYVTGDVWRDIVIETCNVVIR